MPGAKPQPYVSVSPWSKPIFLAALAVVTCLSLVPGSHDPTTSQIDKLKHAAAYALLGALGLRAYQRRPRSIASFLFGWGLLMEFGQKWVPNRTFDWFDVLANSSGILLAWIVVSVLQSFSKNDA